MDLDEYLWRNRITKKDFAKKVKVTACSLSSIVFKKVTPNLTTAMNIVKATNGQVPYEELVKDSDKINLFTENDQ